MPDFRSLASLVRRKTQLRMRQDQLAMIAFSPQMRFSNLFLALGWLLAVTALGLLLTPWRWHHRFGEWAIPLAIRYMKLLALSAFILGAFILYATFPAI